MEEATKINKKKEDTTLFQQEVNNQRRNEAIEIIFDQSEKQIYTKDEVLNSVILGDALNV